MRAGPPSVETAAGRAVGSLVPADATVLVACSGGADSVALAAALAPRVRCVIGHVDHGLRPESGREAESVRALAGALGVRFLLGRAAGLALGELGLEGAAREARYRLLAQLAIEAGASFVATAHTRRDQAETLLLRLARGAGPGALGGVRARRELAPGVLLVRPLLAVPRAATEQFCRERGLPFVDDPHNLDPARARGRLRGAWTVLAGLNPRLEEALAGAAGLLAEEDDLVSGLARSMLQPLSTPLGLDARGLSALHPALQRRCLLSAAVAAGLRPERAHLEAVREALCSPRFSISVPGGRIAIEAGWLRFGQPAAVSGPAPEVAVGGPGSYAWNRRALSVVGGAAEGTVVDLSKAPFPWTLRGHRPGDRFRPGGGRTRKVADLWADARIPRERRPHLAVLADAGGILFWVEGVRVGAACLAPQADPATFVIRTEMDGTTGALG